MDRHATRIEDDALYVEAEWDLLEVGSLAEIEDLVGGPTYVVEYEEDYSRAVDWLDLDDDGKLTIDVRETLASMTYPGVFVENLAERPVRRPEGEASPERTRYFVDVMTEVWGSKGNLDDRDNPFLE